MNMLRFFEKLDKEKLQKFKEFYNISGENHLDLYASFSSLLEKNITEILQNLNSKETFILYHAVHDHGFELDSLEDFDFDNLKKALRTLEEKALVFSRKSVQKVRPVIKVFPFSELVEIIEKNIGFYTMEDLFRKIIKLKGLSLSYNYHDMPFDMFHFFFAGGTVARKEFIIQQFGEASIKYFQEENLIKETLLIANREDGFHFYPCYEIDPNKFQKASVNVIRSISYHTRIFNDIIKLIYIITKNDILITKKGDINKKHYDKIVKEINSENIAWFLIKFFTKHKFVDIENENNYIYLTERGYHFFKQNIKDVYEKILKTDSFLERIYSIIKNINVKEFGLADITLTYLKENFIKKTDIFFLRETRRNILKYVEILSYMGILVQKYTTEGFVIYSFNDKYKNLINDESAPLKPLVISPSMEVTVYPQELDLQTSYILNIFMEVKTFSDIFVYQITQKSIKRAIYFGFSVDSLVDVLKKRSRNEVPTNAIGNLERWQEQFKQGHISNQTILETEKEVLDMLQHSTDYGYLIIKRLNEQTAIVSPSIYKNRIMEDINVYLYSKE